MLLLLNVAVVVIVSTTSSEADVEEFGLDQGCDAPVHDTTKDDLMSPLPGSYLEIVNQLRQEPFDRDAILEKSRTLRLAKDWKGKGKAALHLAHIMEHDPLDYAWIELRKLIESMMDQVHANAETLRFNPKGVVLQDSRFRMSSLAAVGSVTVDGLDMKIEPLTDKGTLFVVNGFLSKSEALMLQSAHTSLVATESSQGHLLCDTTGRFRKVLKGEQESLFVDGYNCIQDKDTNALGMELKWSNWTQHFAEEQALIDTINRRIEQVTGLKSLMGHPSNIISYDSESFDGVPNARTDCDPGGKYVPRKHHAATISIFLNDNFEGGSEGYPAIDASIKPVAGSLVVQYNFDGQECAPWMAREEQPVTSGSKYALRRTFDNTVDPTLSSRPFSWAQPDTAKDQRKPYQSIGVCNEDSCRLCVANFNCMLEAAVMQDYRDFSPPKMTAAQLAELQEIAQMEQWERGWDGMIEVN